MSEETKPFLTKKKKKSGLPARGICFDFETSGYLPPKEIDGHFVGYADKHQGVSIGAIIFDLKTLTNISEIYIEFKFDPANEWSDEAEKIHGLTREYLNEHGVSQEEGAEKFLNWVLENGIPLDDEWLIMGHNKDFDIAFLHKWLNKLNVMPKIFYRGINTCDVGIAAFGIGKSDLLFERLGFEKRGDHNALDDARMTLAVAQVVREAANIVFGPGKETELEYGT